MRQIVLVLSALFFGIVPVSLRAADHDLYDNAVAFDLGYAIVSADANSLYAGKSFGLMINRNLSGDDRSLSLDALQFAIHYAQLNDPQRDHTLSFGSNALWYMENLSNWTPYLKAGLGIQFFSDNAVVETSDHFFGTVGGGIEYQLRGDTSVIGEVVDHRTFSSENTLKASVGIKYSFGQD